MTPPSVSNITPSFLEGSFRYEAKPGRVNFKSALDPRWGKDCFLVLPHMIKQLLGAEKARNRLLPMPITKASSPGSTIPNARRRRRRACPPHTLSSVSSIIHREKPSPICSAAAYSPLRHRRVCASTSFCHSNVHFR